MSACVKPMTGLRTWFKKRLLSIGTKALGSNFIALKIMQNNLNHSILDLTSAGKLTGIRSKQNMLALKSRPGCHPVNGKCGTTTNHCCQGLYCIYDNQKGDRKPNKATRLISNGRCANDPARGSCIKSGKPCWASKHCCNYVEADQT